MAGGRPRKSLEQHVLDGTYRADRHGSIPEDLSEPLPQKPRDLSASAGKVWDTLVGLLAGVAKERDGPLLADLCRWWAELKRVQAVLAKTWPGAKGYQGLLVAAGICTDKADKIASRFGLTPSDRAKLRTEMSGPPKAKVKVRQQTKIDKGGKPSKTRPKTTLDRKGK